MSLLAALLIAQAAPDLVHAEGRWAAFDLGTTCEARGRAWRHLADAARQPRMTFRFEPGRPAFLGINLRRVARPGSSVMLVVDQRNFLLESDGRAAWARSEAQMLDIVRALRSGARMRVSATQRSGARFTDYYPLDGVNAAIDAAAGCAALKRQKTG